MRDFDSVRIAEEIGASSRMIFSASRDVIDKVALSLSLSLSLSSVYQKILRNHLSANTHGNTH